VTSPITIAAIATSLSLLSHAPTGTPASELLWTWKWDNFIGGSLIVISLLYAIGLRRVWKRGVGHRINLKRALCFPASMIVLVAALLSPIDAISAELNWMHMIQHMLLMNIAAPLFVVAAPGYIIQRSLDFRARYKLNRVFAYLGHWQQVRYYLWHPAMLWIVYGAVLWIWHHPILYDAALANQLIHDVQHIMFFAVSCLFWRILFDPIARLKFNRGLGVIYLFATSLHATILGVFMALSPKLWYQPYAATTPSWGLSAIEDQQLAGLIMWMPACMIYAVCAAWVFGVWLRDTEAKHETLNQQG